MKIGWLWYPADPSKFDGGNYYNHKVLETLGSSHKIEFVNPKRRPGKLGFFNQLFDLSNLDMDLDLWVRDFWSTTTMPFDGTGGKNIALVHHIDPSVSRYRLFYGFMKTLFEKTAPRLDAVVVISRYWRDYFLGLGCRRVEVISPCTEAENYHFLEQDITDFRERQGLMDKPIVYLGNCQRAKGVVEAYGRLKDLDVHLVTSGKKMVDIPALNLFLDFPDYLKLLKASSVVVCMSRFKEGWGITPHEAMLFKTPVVGSGLGGMGDLLAGGGQIICDDLADLKMHVENLLGDEDMRNRMGVRGHDFVRQFTLKRFQDRWIDVVGSF